MARVLIVFFVLISISCSALGHYGGFYGSDMTGSKGWSDDPAVNIRVSASQGDQANQRVISDGQGGFITAWERLGDIFVQRLDEYGERDWGTEGVTVCGDASLQEMSGICRDGSGGAIIVWRDARNGVMGIWGQRIGASGSPMWTIDGVQVSGSGDYTGGQAISDDAGGVYVVYEGSESGVFCTRLDGMDGSEIWTIQTDASGMLCSGTAAAEDGTGGVLLGWERRSVLFYGKFVMSMGGGARDDGSIYLKDTIGQSSPPGESSDENYSVKGGFWKPTHANLPISESDIYVQRLDSAGTELWGAGGICLYDTSEAQKNPRAASDGSGCGFFVWEDMRSPSNTRSLYIQKIDSGGSIVWRADGVQVYAGGASEYELMSHAVVSDSEGGAVITWCAGNRDVYATRIDSNGDNAWGGEVALTDHEETSGVSDYPYQSVSDGLGGAFTVFSRRNEPANSYEIVCQSVAYNGSLPWGINGEAVCIYAQGERYNALVAKCDGNMTGALCCWIDERTVDSEALYVMGINLYGELGDPCSTLPTITPTLTPVPPTPTPEPPTLTPTIPPPPAVVWIDDDFNDSTPGWGYDHFSVIQAGLDAVADGGDIYVASGLYNETIGFDSSFNKNNISFFGESGDRPTVAGGMHFDNDAAILNINFENMYFKGDAGGNNAVIGMTNLGAVQNFSMKNCVIDGENAIDRHGLAGKNFEGSFSVTDTEFKNILGWAAMDMNIDSPDGANELPINSITFTGNYIHDSNGVTALRGNEITRSILVNVADNSWDNIGGNGGAAGGHWTALEVNHSAEVNIYGNAINDVSQGQNSEGKAIIVWDIVELICRCNDITNNYEGIYVYGGGGVYGGPYAVPFGYVAYNNIMNNSEYGLTVDDYATGDPLRADFNYWNAADGPGGDAEGSGDAVYGNAVWEPWLNAVQEPPCPPPCYNDGDVDNNGSLTPNDGMMTFRIYIGYISYPTYEEECSSDCDGNGYISPGDGQCIFWSYLEMGCECAQPVQNSVPMNYPGEQREKKSDSPDAIKPEYGNRKIIVGSAQGCRNEIVSIPIIMDSADAPVASFGLTLQYDGNILEFVDVDHGELTEEWFLLDAYPQKPGMLKVGGFDLYSEIPSRTRGALAYLNFRVVCEECGNGEQSECRITDLLDDIKHFEAKDGRFTYNCIYQTPTGVFQEIPAIMPGGLILLTGLISAIFLFSICSIRRRK